VVVVINTSNFTFVQNIHGLENHMTPLYLQKLALKFADQWQLLS
jgi:hypothetical protein